MSVLVQMGEQHFEIADELLDQHEISAEEFDAKRETETVADKEIKPSEFYADAVQIGCGCCTHKAGYGASC